MCVQNLKFVALPHPEIIGGTPKIWAVPGYAHGPFSPKFFMGLCSVDPVNVPAKFEVRNFTRSCRIIAIEVLGGGCEPAILEKSRLYRGSGWYGDGTFQKSVGDFL